MNLHKKLMQLLQSGKAIRHHGNQVVVPMGKYMGCYILEDDEAISRAPEPRSFGSPDKLEFWLRGVRKIFSLGPKRKLPREHSSYRIEQVRATREIYLAWKASKVPQFYREMQPHIYSMSKSSDFSPGLLTRLLFLTGTRLFGAYQAHPVRFNENFKSIKTQSLLGLPIQLRWRLVLLCYRMSWKRAVRILFPRTHPRFVNSCESLQTFLQYLEKKVAVRATEDGDTQAHSEWKQNRVCFHQTRVDKSAYLNYHRRWGHEGMVKLQEYFRELKRSKELQTRHPNLVLPPEWGLSLVEPTEARRRHDRLTDLVLDATHHQDEPLISERHRQNWAALPAPPDGWRPLLTKKDFLKEGKVQHHCVATYYGYTGSMYAHIEHAGELATLQWDMPNPNRIKSFDPVEKLYASTRPHIRQLFGACNAQVSQQMRDHVNQTLQELVAKSQEKIS